MLYYLIADHITLDWKDEPFVEKRCRFSTRDLREALRYLETSEIPVVLVGIPTHEDDA